MICIVLTPRQPTDSTDLVEQHYFKAEAYAFRTLGPDGKVAEDEVLHTVMAGVTPMRIALKVKVTPYNP